MVDGITNVNAGALEFHDVACPRDHVEGTHAGHCRHEMVDVEGPRDGASN